MNSTDLSYGSVENDKEEIMVFERQVNFTSIYEADGEIDDRDFEKEFDATVEAGNSITKDNLAANPDFPQSAISNTPRAIDANKVDGFDANATPTASNILPLDADKHFPVTVIEDGKLPIAKLKIYESGWLAKAEHSTKIFDHGLGVVPKIIQVWMAENDDGTGWCVSANIQLYDAHTGNGRIGTGIVEVTTSQIKIRSASSVATFEDADGDAQAPTSGYCKVIAIA